MSLHQTFVDEIVDLVLIHVNFISSSSVSSTDVTFSTMPNGVVRMAR